MEGYTAGREREREKKAAKPSTLAHKKGENKGREERNAMARRKKEIEIEIGTDK